MAHDETEMKEKEAGAESEAVGCCAASGQLAGKNTVRCEGSRHYV